MRRQRFWPTRTKPERDRLERLLGQRETFRRDLSLGIAECPLLLWREADIGHPAHVGEHTVQGRAATETRGTS